jgi:hypothetical protein
MVRSSNLSILMNKKDGTFLIRNFAIDPRYGYRAEFGELVPVEIESMHTHGLEIVLANLEGFFERDALKDLNERPRRSREKNLELDRTNYKVGVSLEGTELCLSPMKRVRGGFVGIECPDIELDANATSEKFFRLLTKAFAMCKRYDRRGR